MKIHEELIDQELIRRYLVLKDERAIEVLVRRYYDTMFGRIVKSVKNSDDAHDLCQQLWIKVVRNIQSYEEQGKFINYLNYATSNLLKDYWRSNYSNDFEELTESDIGSPDSSIEDSLASKQMMNVLVTQLIPKLPPKLRLPFLLKHESEYWEEKKRLMWHHVAEMNDMSVREAADTFQDARDKLIINTHSPTDLVSLSEEEQLLFLLWTQAQREHKHAKLTEDYFAKLMGIPVNTFKTRYRAAIKELRKGIDI